MKGRDFIFSTMVNACGGQDQRMFQQLLDVSSVTGIPW